MDVLGDAADRLEDPDWAGPRSGGQAALRAICVVCPDDDPTDLDSPIQVALRMLRDEVGVRLSLWDAPKKRVIAAMRRAGQGRLV